MQKQPSEGFFKKYVIKNLKKIIRNPLRKKVFTKSVRRRFLQNTAGRLLLITAVSIGVKGELVHETVNYDTETKASVKI